MLACLSPRTILTPQALLHRACSSALPCAQYRRLSLQAALSLPRARATAPSRAHSCRRVAARALRGARRAGDGSLLPRGGHSTAGCRGATPLDEVPPSPRRRPFVQRALPRERVRARVRSRPPFPARNGCAPPHAAAAPPRRRAPPPRPIRPAELRGRAFQVAGLLSCGVCCRLGRASLRPRGLRTPGVPAGSLCSRAPCFPPPSCSFRWC